MNFTDFELQIIKLISEEYNTKAIAQKLKVSTKTVDNYKERLRRRIGALNSIGLVVYAIKNKLIDIS
jgi:DNA-binding NarL/FixJ family response regulator